MNKSREADVAPDYARIGATLQIVGQNLTEAMDIRAGQNSG